MKENLSIYLHYPFCFSKCPYCDFNSYANLKIDNERLLKAYLKEINFYGNILKNRNVNTIFFGGGTPSIMSVPFLEKILCEINKIWDIDNSVEISLEANPSSVEIEKFRDFKLLGINRISIGVQALNNYDLKFLGRLHSLDDSLNAIKVATSIFKDRYSIDLIYARPEQTLKSWKDELLKAIELSPYHLSLYQLTIEEGTYFYKKKLKTISDEDAEGLYNLTMEITEKNNIPFYEVSNYARNGYECRHNMNYWNSGEWIGIGAGAHGRVSFSKKRLAINNLRNPLDWIEKVEKKSIGFEEIEKLNEKEIFEEFLLMGLRKREGVDLKYFNRLIKGIDFFSFLDKNNLNMLNDKKLIEVFKNGIKVSKDRFFILNSIIEKLL